MRNEPLPLDPTRRINEERSSIKGDLGDPLSPADHRLHVAQRKAEAQRYIERFGHSVEPPASPAGAEASGAVFARYQANVFARRAERAAETAPKVVVLPHRPADPPAVLRVGADPDDDDLGWEAIE
jgi:hypothetical protein